MSGLSASASLDNQPILALQFNQNFTSLILGTHFGYSIIRTTDESFEEEFKEDKKKVCLIERLFSSSLLTMVRLEESNKLLVYHFRKRTLICHYRYSSTILSIKLNRKRLVVCVEDKIFIHCIMTLTMLHEIEDTPVNRNGVMALSSNENNCYLAYPGSAREGSVVLLDALTFHNVASIVCHNGQLATMDFNKTGNLLATASVKGTVIRVFSIPSGNRVMEFRRGITRVALIGSLTFSLDDAFLVAASNTQTVHVFRLDIRHSSENSDESNSGRGEAGSRFRSNSDCYSGSDSDSIIPSTPTNSGSSWFEWMTSTFRGSASYLPSQVSDMMSQDRAFAFARLSSASADVPKIAAIVNHKNLPRLVVASWDGYLNLFAIDPVNGGEAHHIKTINLLAPREVGDPMSPFPASLYQSNNRTRDVSISSADSQVSNQSATTRSTSTAKASTELEDKTSLSFTTITNSDITTDSADRLNLEDPTEFPCLAQNIIHAPI